MSKYGEPLTPSERRILNMRLVHKRYAQIAIEEDIPETTVASRLANSKRKLGADSVTHALYIWRYHPHRNNEVLWKLVDDLAEIMDTGD